MCATNKQTISVDYHMNVHLFPLIGLMTTGYVTGTLFKFNPLYGALAGVPVALGIDYARNMKDLNDKYSNQ